MKNILITLFSLVTTLSLASPSRLIPRAPRNQIRTIPTPDTLTTTPIKALPASTVANKTIFSPPANYNDPQVLYARTVELANGDILATWENYSPEPPLVYFPIYRSQDGGVSWVHIANVTDQVNGWGMRYQPVLYRSPVAIGGFAKNTVFLAGNSIPTNLSNTEIDLYASTDSGFSWYFVSKIASGGPAIPDNGLTPVWEPFLLVWNGQMICYYSDQRDPLYGQKLVYQASTNLRTWGPVINTVNVSSNYYARPGMFTTAQLANGSFIATYEYGGAPGFSSYQFQAYYKIAPDPLSFGSAIGYPIIATDGSTIFSSPYVTVSKYGGKNGTVIVNAESSGDVLVNTKLGALGSHWTSYSTPQPSAYARCLMPLRGHQRYVMITGGGYLPPAHGLNRVATSVVDLEGIEY